MEKLRSKKILTMIVLVVAVLGLSIGFAAYSNVLTISSEAQVNPDASTFSVKFSKVSDQVLDGEDNLVYPEGLNEDGAKIVNNTNPTITGLVGRFAAPGESVQYKFYVRNEGEYLAYLNSIEIGQKVCTAYGETTPSLVSDACNSISVSVKIGNMDPITSTQEKIIGQTLAINSYQEVIVDIKYAENGTRTDGPFRVKLGDIYLTYSSIQEFEFASFTGVIYRSSTEELSIGDNIKGISYETNAEYISENRYLKHEVENNIITASYACGKYEENGVIKETCLKGADSSYYASNIEILRSVEPYFNTLNYHDSKGYCTFDDSYSYCNSNSLRLYAYSGGTVTVDVGDLLICYVNSDGLSNCN